MVDVDNLINFDALQLVNFVVNCDQLIQICSAPVLPACNSCNLCQHLFANVYLYILISPREKRVIYRIGSCTPASDTGCGERDSEGSRDLTCSYRIDFTCIAHSSGAKSNQLA